MKLTGIALLLFIICIYNSALSQDRKYLYPGMEFESFLKPEPLNLIIDDYNEFHSKNDLNTSHSFIIPDYTQGFSVGTKIHVRFSEFGGNVHFNSFSTASQGTASDGTEYYNKIIVSHNGFLIFYRILIINTNYFRTGSGVGFKVEQLKTKLNFTKDPSVNTMIPANKALMSGQISYNISVGGPKFNMDIGVFYQIPFWKISVNGLNTSLNKDFAKDYSTEQMNFNAVSWGINFCIGLGSKDNYDF